MTTSSPSDMEESQPPAGNVGNTPSSAEAQRHVHQHDPHQYDASDPYYTQDTDSEDRCAPHDRQAEAEQAALSRIVWAFRRYEEDALFEVSRWERNYAKLSSEFKALLPNQLDKFAKAKQCIAANAKFFRTMLHHFQSDGAPQHLQVPENRPAPTPHPGDAEKVRYVLKNLARDWTAEGALERAQSHGPLLEELEKWLPTDPAADHAPYVLVPGAGLARLCVEVARRGYSCQGNDFSYYMLMCSSFILNHSEEAKQFTIYPWVLHSCNHISDDDQLAGMAMPDVLPSDCPIRVNGLSMCAGDFVEVYSASEHRGAWNAVVTCFFLDTAHNVLEYLRIIADLLPEGGYWLNMGPLLYHWSDAHTYLPEEELSIEISLEDVERIARHYGLRLEKKEMRDCLYTADTRSMLQSVYKAALFVMVKDSSVAGSGTKPLTQTASANGHTGCNGH